MLLKCGVCEDSWESLELQEDPTSPSKRKSVLGVHWKEWCWSWNSNTLATWCEELTHWKRPWCWEGLRAWGEGANRGWDGWISSLTQCTWVWVNSGSWWWTGRPDMLQSMGLQRVGLDWTELSLLLLLIQYCFSEFVCLFVCFFKEPTYFLVSWRGYTKDKTYGLVKSHSEVLLLRVLQLLFSSLSTEINNVRYQWIFWNKYLRDYTTFVYCFSGVWLLLKMSQRKRWNKNWGNHFKGLWHSSFCAITINPIKNAMGSQWRH